MKKLFIAALMMGVANTAFAQSGTNSPYSQYGLGLQSEQFSGFNRGMNGLGLGFREHNQVNYMNPASYSALDSLTFIFDMGASGQITNLEENGKKMNARNSSFDYAVAAFRAAPHLGVSFGLVPFTTMGYNFNASGTTTLGNETLKSTNDPTAVMADVCAQAKKTLDNTPKLLPALAKAGVVDAGGMGLLIIFEAIRDVFEGGEVIVQQEQPVEKKTVEAEGAVTVDTFSSVVGQYDAEINFTYCTEMLITKKPDCDDPIKLRAYLETIGDCVVVVDDDEIIKVHVHTNNPGKAIEKGLEFGYINFPKVENMKLQHEKEQKKAKSTFTPAEQTNEFGFVAVAAGNGIETMFKDLGVDCVVKGGQTMNPSTQDILEAIMSCPAKTVFVLPNNKNIIMAAEQAVKLADRKVCVLQTRTIPQGMSAMLAYDPDADFNTNRIEMTAAIERVSTGQITFAARDSDYEGHSIKQGEILAMENGRLSFVDKDLAKAAFKLTKKLVKGDSSFITVIYGSDVTDDAAEALYKQISNKYSNLDVNLINGGQPVYYYIVSAE